MQLSRLGEILVTNNLITREQLAKALEEQKMSGGQARLGRARELGLGAHASFARGRRIRPRSALGSTPLEPVRSSSSSSMARWTNGLT